MYGIMGSMSKIGVETAAEKVPLAAWRYYYLVNKHDIQAGLGWRSRLLCQQLFTPISPRAIGSLPKLKSHLMQKMVAFVAEYV